MIRASLVIALVVFIFSPTTASADNIVRLNGATIFQSRDSVYRIRSSTKPPQLSEQNGLPGPSLVTLQAIFLFFDGRLFRTDEGLSYREIDLGGVLTEPVFIQVEEETLLFGYRAGTLHSWRLEVEKWQLLRQTPNLTGFTASQVEYRGGTFRMAATLSGQLRAYRLSSDLWIEEGAVLCSSAAAYFSAPRFGAVCSEGTSWQYTGTEWAPLFFGAVTFRTISEKVIVVSAVADPSLLLIATDLLTAGVNISPGTPTLLFAGGRRILVQLNDGKLYELLWEQPSPVLLPISSTFSSVIRPTGTEDWLLVSAGTTAYVSDAAGRWWSVVTAGDFNHAKKTTNGMWVWQTNIAQTSGGLSQYLADGQPAFLKVNPWSSTSSPIQAIALESVPAYVSVITNSGTGNVNLYRSDNLTSWSRVTLPSSPTLVRDIASSRLLAAGTLVETTGLVTVPAGIVGGEIIYIQDITGGIQVYLSSNKGNLVHRSPERIRVTGEISSSEVRRIVLAAPDEVTSLGVGNPISPQVINLGEVGQYLGRLLSLEGRVTEVSVSEVTLGGELKIDFAFLNQNVKNLFRINDTMAATIVADWNSSTDQVEGWYGGGGYGIVARAIPPTAPKPVKSTTKKTAGTAASTARKTDTTQPAAAAKVARIQPLVQGARSEALDGNRTSMATNVPAPMSTPMLATLGLLTGMLVVQGRRFRRYL